MTHSSAPAGHVKLPPQLTARLRKLVHRVRRIQLLRGAALTVAVALAATLILMAIDAAILIPSDAVRLGLSLCGALFVVSTLWTALVRPLRQPITLVKMARVLETRHPELQERISSAIELLSMGDDAAARGSRQLIDLLAQDARIDLARVSARHEFTGRTLRPAFIGSGCIAGVLIVLLVAWPGPTTLLLKRAIAPLRSYDNLQAASMTVQPGDARLLAGQPLTIQMLVPVDPVRRAEVAIEEKGRPAAIERMRRTTEDAAKQHRFELTLPAVARSFRYRVRLGSGLSRYYCIEVIPPPAHGDLALDYRFPAYTGLPTTQIVASAVSPIRGIAGTQMKLSTRLNRPLEAGLLLGRHRTPAKVAADLTPVWNWRLATNTATRWALALRDTYGFTNALEWAGYEVDPDLPPNVQLTYPSGASFTLPTYGLLRMTYTLSDDFGIGTVKLNVKGDGLYNEWALDVTVERKGPRTWIVNRELPLSEFQLSGMRQLKIWLQVEDNLPPELGGPNRSRSRLIALNLDDRQTRNLADQVRVPQRDTLTNLIAAAASRLDAAALTIDALNDEALAKTDVSPELQKQLAEAETQAAAAAELMRQAAQEAKTSLFAGVLPELKATTTEAVAPAIAEAEAILLADPAQRVQQAQTAMAALQFATTEAQELMAEILEKDEQLAKAAALENLAGLERQQAEQARALQMTGAEMKTWQERQGAIAGQIREAEKLMQAGAATETPVPVPGQAPPPAEPAAPAAWQPIPPPPPGIEDVVNAILAANAAMDKQLAQPIDEPALLKARETEALARQTQQAANRALDAARQAELLAMNRDGLALAKVAAEETKTAAQETEMAALQVRLYAEEIHESLTQAGQVPAAENAAKEADKLAQQAADLARQAGRQAERAAQTPTELVQQAAEAAVQNAAANEAALEKLAQATRPAEGRTPEAMQADAAAAKAVAQANREEALQTREAAEQAAQAARAANDPQSVTAAQQAKQAAAANQRAAEKTAQAAELAGAGNAPQAAAQEKQAQELVREAGKQAEEARRLADRAAAPLADQALQLADAARQEAEALKTAQREIADAAQKLQGGETEAAQQQAHELGRQVAETEALARRDQTEATQTGQLAKQRRETQTEAAAGQAKLAAETNQRAAQLTREAARLVENKQAEAARAKLAEAEPLTVQAAEQAAAAQAAAVIAQQEPFEQARQLAELALAKAQRAETSLRPLTPRTPPAARDPFGNELLPAAKPLTPTETIAVQIEEVARQTRQAAEITHDTAGGMARDPDDAAQPAPLTLTHAAEAMQQAEQSAQMARTAADAAANLAEQAGETTQAMLAQSTSQAEAADKQAQEAGQKAAILAAALVPENTPGTMQQLAGQITEAATTTQAAAQKAKDSTTSTQQAPTGQTEQGGQEAREAAQLARQAGQQAAQAAQGARAVLVPEAEQQEAARLANQAAQQLRQMAVAQARAAGLDPETMQPDGQNAAKSDKQQKRRRPEENSAGGENTGQAEEEEFEDGESMPDLLKRIGFPKLEWARFKSTLDTGMLEGALQHVAPEYRDLVRRYFLLLAREESLQ